MIYPDIKKLGRFGRPGHSVAGTRMGCHNLGAGWDFVLVAVDDTTQLVYVELLGDERRNSTTPFMLHVPGRKVVRVADSHAWGPPC